MKKFVWLAFLATVANAQYEQKTSNENMVHDRGQTNVFRGSDPMTLYGTLIDAGCKDRSAENLSSTPEAAAPLPAAAKKAAGPVSSGGVTVDAKTLAAAQADIVSHQVPDLATRQSDPSCAITGATALYALVLPDGRLLALDGGGNTLAAETVFAAPQGRAMLNGKANGFKPKVKVYGRVRGDRVIATDVQVQ